MRSTRSNTIPDNCFIFGIPMEVLQQMMRFLPPESLASLSETCKRFRDLSNPVLLKELVVQAKKNASFDPLKKLCKNGERKKLVRSIIVINRVYSLDREAAFSKILVGMLPKFPNLTSVTFPFSFLSTQLFKAVYCHPSISTLSLNDRVCNKHPNTLNLLEDPLPLLPKRPVPLVVPHIEVNVFADEAGSDLALLGSLLDYLQFYGVAVSNLEVENHVNGVGFSSNEGRLASRLLPGLVSLHVRVPEDPGPSSFDWVSKVFSVQTSLEQVQPTVGAWGSFVLNSNTWRLWSNGVGSSSPSLDFSSWTSTPLQAYKAIIGRRSGIADLHLASRDTLTVEPAIVASLNSLAPGLATLRLGAGWDADLLWPDLDGAIDAFASLSSLTTLHLKGSLTPTYHSLKRVAACSQYCYETLEMTHPTLHAAAELVGGRQALQSLDLEINLARFRKIVAGVGIPLTEHEDGGEMLVKWEVANMGGWVVGYDAIAKMKGGERVVSMKDTDGGRSTSSPKALSCIVCETWDLGDLKDPVQSIMACEVGEVRAALKAGGFDLDEFDSRGSSSSRRRNLSLRELPSIRLKLTNDDDHRTTRRRPPSPSSVFEPLGSSPFQQLSTLSSTTLALLDHFEPTLVPLFFA